MQTIKDHLRRLIDWSGHYAKTDMQYVVKSGAWLSVGQGGALILAFCMSVAFANLIPKDLYGNYKFILSAVGILGTLSLSGLGPVVTQATATGDTTVFPQAVKTYIRWGILVCAVSLLVGLYYAINENFPLALSFSIAGLTFPLINGYALYASYLNGKKDFKRSALYWLSIQGLLDFTLVLAMYLGANIITLVTIYFVVQTVTTFWFYTKTLKVYPPESGKHTGGMIAYAKHLSLMGFIGGVANQVDKILVFHFSGAVALATYSFAFAIPEQIKGSYKNLFAIALPKYSENSALDIKASIQDKMLRLTLITVLIVIAYILLSPLIFSTLFPKYLDSVFYSQIYIVGLLTIPGISLTGIYFQVKKDTRLQYKINIINSIFTILIGVFLVSCFGILGAVIENTVSWTFMLLLNLYYFYTN